MLEDPCSCAFLQLQRAGEREKLTPSSAEPLAAGRQDSSGSGSVSQHCQEEWGPGHEKLHSPAVVQESLCSVCISSAAAASGTQLISQLMHHCSCFLIFVAPEVHLDFASVKFFFLNNVSTLLLWIQNIFFYSLMFSSMLNPQFPSLFH